MAGRQEQPQQQPEDVLWVFELGSIGGVPISIHYTFVLLLFLQVFAATLSYHDITYNALMFTLYGPVLFVTVLIHELGHACAARSLGGIVDRIVLWPLGGFSVFGPSHGSSTGVSEDLWITIVGPLTHILQGAMWTGIYAAVEKGDLSGFSNDISLKELREGGAIAFISNLCVQAIVFNIALIIANLAIPAYPLDGGRAMVALLVMGEFKVATAARITSILGVIVGLLMLFTGVYLYAAETSAGGLFLAVIACFVISSGLKMWKAVALGRLYEHPLFRLECYQYLRGRAPNANISPRAFTPGHSVDSPQSSTIRHTSIGVTNNHIV